MSVSRRAFLAALFGLPAIAAASSIPAGARFGLAGDMLVDGELRTGQALLMDNGIIEAVIPSGGVTDRPIISVNGVILPGIINAHVHRVHSAASRGQRFLSGGVTSLGDMASPLAALPDLLDNPAGRTATAACAGPMLCPPGGYPLPVHSPEHGLVVTSPAHAREQVRRLADCGATLIKFAMEPGPNPKPWPLFYQATASAIGDEGRRLGLVVRCHVEDFGGLETALAAGAQTVEHVPHRWIADGGPRDVLVRSGTGWEPIPEYADLLERMVRDRVIMTPTLDVLSRSMWNGPELFAPVKTFHDMGGRIAVGNDHPYRRTDAGMPLAEMRLLARAGLDDAAILRAATQTAAHACGFTDRGTLQPGMRADLIVAGRNPLESLAALGDIRLIIKDGMVVENG